MPVPGLFVAVTAAEATLVMAIARAYGEPLELADTAKFLAFSGAKNVGLKAAGEASAVIPIVGLFVRPLLFSASMKTLGNAVINYFEARHPGKEYAP